MTPSELAREVERLSKVDAPYLAVQQNHLAALARFVLRVEELDTKFGNSPISHMCFRKEVLRLLHEESERE